MLLLSEILFAVDTNLPSSIYVAAEYFEFPSGLIKYLSIYLSIYLDQLSYQTTRYIEI